MSDTRAPNRHERWPLVAEKQATIIAGLDEIIAELTASILRKDERIAELTTCLHTVGALIGRFDRGRA
jgi:hypothetical protein